MPRNACFLFNQWLRLERAATSPTRRIIAFVSKQTFAPWAFQSRQLRQYDAVGRGGQHRQIGFFMTKPPSRSRSRESIAKPAAISITLNVNGTPSRLTVAPWTTLLDALRDRLNLTGTKKGCDHGQC